MARRKDGAETRLRLQAAAADLFGQKGYDAATTAEICQHAGANIAAVNYHFGDKESLYRTVWLHLAETGMERHPVDGGLPPDAPAEDRLRAHITALVRRRSDPELAVFHLLQVREHTQPTGLLADLMPRVIEPQMHHIALTIKDLLGPAGTRKAVHLCARSVVSQCLMPEPPGPGSLHRGSPRRLPTRREADAWVEHVFRFSLAGIKAIRAGHKERKPKP